MFTEEWRWACGSRVLLLVEQRVSWLKRNLNVRVLDVAAQFFRRRSSCFYNSLLCPNMFCLLRLASIVFGPEDVLLALDLLHLLDASAKSVFVQDLVCPFKALFVLKVLLLELLVES